MDAQEGADGAQGERGRLLEEGLGPVVGTVVVGV